MGIKTIEKLSDNGSGICIIRSHGESDDVFQEVKSKGYELVDLTCFDVKKVQQRAVELAKKGYYLIILGKKEHPEVKAIYQNACIFAKNKENIIVAATLDELRKNEETIKKMSFVGVILQTTQTKEYLLEVVDYLSGICKVLNITNTICPSTALRQDEAKALAKESDLMVVVGSKKSANTSHLAHLLEKITDTIHIEDEVELEKYKNIIQKANKIGVTAGASTPDMLINKVVDKLERI